MEIKGRDYSIIYNPATTTIMCQGSFRLQGADEYEAIAQLLNDVVAEKPTVITLDLRELRFLNSSGINMLSKFVINVRRQMTSQIMVRGSYQISWQNNSLKNLQRLMPDLKLEFE